MATYNQTGYYTTLNNSVNATDLGNIFFDCSYAQTITGQKNYAGQLVSPVVPTADTQLATKSYVDAFNSSTTITTTINPVLNKNINTVTYPVTNPTGKVSVQYTLPATLTSNQVYLNTDTIPNSDQLFTFGARAGKAIWVAVGAGTNTLAYSEDSINWIGLGTSIFSTQGYAIGWNGTLWVATGAGTNSLAYSYNGTQWFGLGTTIFSRQGYALAWNGAMWVASGAGTTNSIAYSYDGINWFGNGNTSLGAILSIAWNGQVWLATGSNSSSNLAIYSYNGIQWITTPTNSLATSVQGTTVAWTGSNWLMSSVNSQIIVEVAGGASSNQFAYSLNGSTWVPTGAGVFNWTNNIVWNGQYWVAVGTGGTTGNTMAYSADGINWIGTGNYFATGRNTSYGVNMTYGNILGQGYSVAWNGNTWLAGGIGLYGNIFTSNDGINWAGNAYVNIGGGGSGNSYLPKAITAVGWTGNNWVAGASNPKLPTGFFMSQSYYSSSSNYQNVISTDGINWSAYNTLSTGGSMYGIFYKGGIWWNSASLNGTSSNIQYSYDSVNWSASSLNTLTYNGISCMEYNGSMWVCGIFGGGGTYINPLFYSYDAINWTGLVYSNVMPYPRMIRYNGSLWVAVGVNASSIGVIAYSTTGTTWTSSSHPFLGNLFDVAYNGNIWVAIGRITSGTGPQPTLGYSNNGINWSSANDKVRMTNGYSVGWNGSIWVAGGIFSYVGTGNTIAYSYDGIIWTGINTYGATTSGFQGRTVAWNGLIWVISCYGAPFGVWSTNGINWNTISAPSGSGGSIGYIAFGTTNTSNRSLLRGNIFTSANAITWKAATSTILNIKSIVQGGNTTLACGGPLNTAFTYTYPAIYTPYKFNNMSYSTNGGTTWIDFTNPAFDYVNSVAWNGLLWVAVGGGIGNSIATTTIGNGVTGWTRVLGSTGIFSVGNSVSWNGNVWIATGEGGNTIATSTNGTTWIGLGSGTFNVSGNTIGIGSIFPTSVLYNKNILDWKKTNTTYILNTSSISNNGTFTLAAGAPNVITNPTTLVWSIPPYYTTNNNMSYNAGGGPNWNDFNNPAFTQTVQSLAWNGSVWMATGQGGNTLAYSYNGTTWIGLGNSVFSVSGNAVAWSGPQNNQLYLPGARTLALGTGNAGTIAYAYAGTNNVLYDLSNNWTWGITNTGGSTTTLFAQANAAAWNGTTWIAVGTPVAGSVVGNTLAYSSIYNITQATINTLGNAGNVWTGIGNYTFSTAGNAVGWNGNVWVAAGQGGNSLAYSPNGFSWFGLGTNVFTTSATSVTWNGSYWLATGAGGNTLAYSPDGIIWQGLGNGMFTTQANGAAWNGTYWVAAGQGGNTLAVSWDTFTWAGLGSSYFTTLANAVATNPTGTMWVAAGQGGRTLMYSIDGIIWTVVNNSPFSTQGKSVTWNGKFWVASGTGTNTLGYSSDGINWFGQGSTLLTTPGTAGSVVANQGVGSALIPTNYTAPTTAAIPMWVAGGIGTSNTLAFSFNGIVWTGIGSTTFSTQCNGVAYSPAGLWVTAGSGTNTLAYSTTGNTWTGLGQNIFSNSGQSVAYNGVMWVASGQGLNTLAYSYAGNVWYGSGTSIFTTKGNGMAWNGQLWVATGQGTNSLAYSYDGVNWTGLGITVFSTAGQAVAWNGVMWMAVGSGTNTLAYSFTGLTWTGLGTTIFTATGYAIAWNGQLWVAVGTGTNAIAWSAFGISNWTGIAASSAAVGYLTTAYWVTWSGQVWMVGGTAATGCTVYSPNGKTWFTSSNTTMATAYAVGYSNFFTNQIVISAGGPGKTQTLDVVSDTYYQTGYNRLNITFNNLQ